MFPYVLILPLWIIVSLVWPVLQSLHALFKKDAKETKIWLFYWVGYAVIGFLFPYVEFVVSVPFAIVASILFDVYYECQLIAVFLLVNPRVRMLDRVCHLAEDNCEPVFELGMQKLEMVQKFIVDKVKEAGQKRQ